MLLHSLTLTFSTTHNSSPVPPFRTDNTADAEEREVREEKLESTRVKEEGGEDREKKGLSVEVIFAKEQREMEIAEEEETAIG
jgi:PAB1-binding protein PBP1